ncbi:MAG: hypothetical protein AAF513_20410 [Pseudomonadota bacterium]
MRNRLELSDRLRPFRRFLIRDLLVLGATLIAWMSGVAQREVEALSVGLGLMTALCALLLHEWAHLYGAYISNAVVHPAPSIFSPFLFDLDSRDNTPAAFLTTSVWGFYATGLFVVMFLCLLRGGTLAEQTALWGAGGLAALTVLIEFPIAWRVAASDQIPAVEIFRRR